MTEPFNLDSFKNDWKKIPDEKHYQRKEIFQMLQRKSITAARWIFILSLIELFLTTISVISMLFNNEMRNFHKSMYQNIGNMTYFFDLLYGLSILVVIVFTFVFFTQYRKISVQSSVDKLTHQILTFRKLVNYYFLTNVALLIPIITLFVWYSLISSSEIDIKQNQILTVVLITACILIAITLVFYWLYYYLIYGTFLRKLRRNARELENIKGLNLEEAKNG